MTDNYTRKATITRIIDGDTVDATVDLGYHVTTTQRLRLIGVDTPERHEDGYAEATQFTSDQLLGKEVAIQSHKADVFGRYLAEVFIDGESFNQRLLAEGLAEVYKR